MAPVLAAAKNVSMYSVQFLDKIAIRSPLANPSSPCSAFENRFTLVFIERNVARRPESGSTMASPEGCLQALRLRISPTFMYSSSGWRAYNLPINRLVDRSDP